MHTVKKFYLGDKDTAGKTIAPSYAVIDETGAVVGDNIFEFKSSAARQAAFLNEQETIIEAGLEDMFKFAEEEEAERDQLTRHDIPQTVKDVLNVAVQNRTIDIFDVYEMAITHGTNWANLVNELCEVAFSNIHWNKESHTQVVAAAEAYWIESVIGYNVYGG